MIFNTFWFLAFILCFYPVYWCVRTASFRKGWLLAACALFHLHFAGPAGVFPIVVLGCVVYAAGLSGRRWALCSGIFLSVAALFFYKYTTFLSQSIFQILGIPETGESGWLSPAAPLAISFFTFEFVHYLADIWKGQPAIRKLQDFALFSIFFPSLVAGPIKRYENFILEMERGLRDVRDRDVSTGMMQVALGFLKKCVADNLQHSSLLIRTGF